MSYEYGLNDLAGGDMIINESIKTHDSVVDDYKGKWCIFLMAKDGQSGVGNVRYLSKASAEKAIKEILDGDEKIYGSDGHVIPVKAISALIPMPTPKT